MMEKFKKIIKDIYIYSKSKVSRLLTYFSNIFKPANLKNIFFNTVKSNNFKTFFLVFFFILFPIVLNSRLTEGKMGTSFLMTFYLCSPIFIFTKKIKRYLLLMIPVVYIPHLSNLSHFFIYKEPISKNGLMALFETNTNEAVGFIKEYTSLSIILLFLITLMIFVIYFKFLKIKDMDKNAKTFSFFQKFFFLLFVVASIEGRFVFYTKLRSKFLLSDFLTTYFDHTAELELLSIKNKRNIKPFENIKSLFGNQKQTFIVIVGESASREHYQIYGYNRKTNPLLSKRNDIYAFNNVKSPHGQTLPSLKKVLTFANFDDMSLLYTKGSIINYFKDAGFKTFWLTKQETLSDYSTYTNIIAHEADVHEGADKIERFAADKGYKIESNDYNLIYKLEEVLKDPTAKKVIFLHLNGSHSPYATNNKEGYTPFTDNKEYSIFGKRKEKLDQYDNTIVLNDLLLNTIIEMLKKQDEISYMVYFSDHGEDARDAFNSCFCHADLQTSKRELLLKIPFITWVSPKYKSLRPDFVNSFNKKLGNPYNNQHLIHSVMSLSGLSNPDIEKSKSIFD